MQHSLLSLVCLLISLFLGILASNFSMLFKPYSQCIFGPITGFFMGFIGHALKDGIQYGNISWAWVLASAITGLVIGLFNKKYDVTTGKFSLMSMIWFNLAQALALLIAYGIVTPIGDRLQFAQAWSYLYAQSFVAGVANFITIAIGGTLLLAIYASSRTQSGSLTKD